MKHRIFGKKLGRNHHTRQALFRTQINSLFLRGSITTTAAKVKALTPLAEKICTRLVSQTNLEACRLLSRYVPDRNLARRLVEFYKNSFNGRSSNFLKTAKIKFRQGDDSLMVKLAFYQDVKPPVAVKPSKADDKTKNSPKTDKTIKKPSPAKVKSTVKKETTK